MHQKQLSMPLWVGEQLGTSQSFLSLGLDSNLPTPSYSLGNYSPANHIIKNNNNEKKKKFTSKAKRISHRLTTQPGVSMKDTQKVKNNGHCSGLS